MRQQRRRFTRRYGERRYKILFVIATEGMKTERMYFEWFQRAGAVIQVEWLKGKHGSAPPQVLKRMQKRLKTEGLRHEDEAWLVVDKDQWTDSQLSELSNWSLKQDNYHLAVSNPMFEYWLLLHFDEGIGISTASQCKDRLKHHWPKFDKDRLDMARLDGGITKAIERAKAKDTPLCSDWPRRTGTTVYRLVEKLMTTESTP